MRAVPMGMVAVSVHGLAVCGESARGLAAAATLVFQAKRRCHSSWAPLPPPWRWATRSLICGDWALL